MYYRLATNTVRWFITSTFWARQNNPGALQLRSNDANDKHCQAHSWPKGTASKCLSKTVHNCELIRPRTQQTETGIKTIKNKFKKNTSRTKLERQLGRFEQQDAMRWEGRRRQEINESKVDGMLLHTYSWCYKRFLILWTWHLTANWLYRRENLVFE